MIMLFIRPVHRDPDQEGVRSNTTPPPNGNLMIKWILKCFMTGIALSGLAYWLVQIAGAQYLATLTSATLLSFLLVYIVWCLTVKRRNHPQPSDSVVSNEPSVLPTASSHRLAPPMLNPALKHYGVPPRDCSPPPSYDEVLRQMGAEAATSSSATYAFPGPNHYGERTTLTSHYDVEAPPIGEEPDIINRIPTTVMTVTINRTPIITEAICNAPLPDRTQISNITINPIPNTDVTEVFNSPIDSVTILEVLDPIPEAISTPVENSIETIVSTENTSAQRITNSTSLPTVTTPSPSSNPATTAGSTASSPDPDSTSLPIEVETSAPTTTEIPKLQHESL